MPRDWPLPTISVVVPTYNRPQSIRRVLKNLSEQICFKFEDLDVCIVDDGSNPRMGYPIDWAFYPIVDWNSFPFQCEYIYRERHPEGLPRAYSSRNIGVEHTHGEVILFLDDDLVFHNHTLWLIQFYHSLWPDICLIPHMAKRGEHRYFTCHFQVRRNVETGWVTSAGLSVRHKWKEAIGGFFFDEEFDTNMGFCDRDLGIRLGKAGCEIVLGNAIPMFIEDAETGSWRVHFVQKWRREWQDAHPGQPRPEDPNWRVLIGKHPELAKQ